MNKKEKMNLFSTLLTIQTMVIGNFISMLILIFIIIYNNNSFEKTITLYVTLFIPIIIALIINFSKDKKTMQKLNDIIDDDNERSFTICPFDSETNKKA